MRPEIQKEINMFLEGLITESEYHKRLDAKGVRGAIGEEYSPELKCMCLVFTGYDYKDQEWIKVVLIDEL